MPGPAWGDPISFSCVNLVDHDATATVQLESKCHAFMLHACPVYPKLYPATPIITFTEGSAVANLKNLICKMANKIYD